MKMLQLQAKQMDAKRSTTPVSTNVEVIIERKTE
jgi:hypothetical protein